MKQVLFITGSYPPAICGVGDYTFKLVNSQYAQAHGWKVLYKKEWALSHFFEYLDEIRKFKPSTVVMQYPTQGYGWSLLPHLLCIFLYLFTKIKVITVLHEYSNATFKNRLAEHFLVWFANGVIATNDYEAANIKKIVLNKNKINTVRICSNIKGSDVINSFENRKFDIVYFGHIRPNKGIEDFLELLESQKERLRQRKIALIGQIPLGFESFYNTIKTTLDELGVEIILNRPEHEISELLNNAKFAYLPFPDGVSERRGSFLACAFNGTLAITTSGKYSTPQLLDCVFVPSGYDKIIDFVDNMSSSEYERYQSKMFEYIHHAIPSTWDEVAFLYDKCL